MEMKVKDLAKKDDQPSKALAGTLVKDLLSKSISKGGKLKAIKIKAKFGDDKPDKPKKKVNPVGY
jgi:hypothetical protein